MNLRRHDRLANPLEVYLTKAISEGRLQAGDLIGSPDQLAKTYRVTPVEALETVNHLLAQGLLSQTSSGELYVSGAQPSGYSDQQHA